MEKNTKTKLYIGISYIILVSIFLFFFFSRFSVQEIISYEFIKQNSSYFLELKKSNLVLVVLTFLILTVLWVFPFLGFCLPIALLVGFIL